jgi:hypothetical protein
MSKLHAFGSALGATQPSERPYVEKYVAFVDILGFKQLVEIADADHLVRSKLIQIIHIFRTTCGEYTISGTKISQFSDSIIISSDRSEMGLSMLLHGCIWLTINLIQYGVLLRGGIALGRVTHDRDILFGIGVNRAYAFDQHDAPPRIGLDERVVDDISRSAGLSSEHYVTEDHANGDQILHTLRELEHYNPNPRLPGMISWDRHAKDISDLIRRQKRDTSISDGARRKWKWFGGYWNIAVTPNAILPKV